MRLHGHRALTVAALLAGAACSTVDRGPIDECQDDVDCGTGSVCSLAQGNICVPEALPPRTVLGFDIRDGDLHVELLGCDPEVSLELGGSELRVQKRGALVRDYNIASQRVRRVQTCDTSNCTGECDPDALTCTEPVDALLDLRSSSRLSLAGPVSDQPTFLAMPGMDGEPPTPVTITWPTYESTSDPLAGAPVRLEVSPTDGSNRGGFWRLLGADASSELTATSNDRCQRAIIGPSGSIRTISGNAVDGATVEFVWDDEIASAGAVIGSAPACDSPETCPPGWTCNEQGDCGLALDGVSAATSTNQELLEGALSHAFLYTYCEGTEDDETLTRRFQVRLTPPTTDLQTSAPLGYPTVIYELEQEFGYFAPGTLGEVNLAKPLCLPDWEPPQTVAFSLVGEPVVLGETELGLYACCSTECLPSPEPGVEPIPPPMIDSCSDFDRVRFETRWFNSDPQEWAFANCLDTAANTDGSSGRYVRDVTECAPEGCSAPLTIGEAVEQSRTYTVSITQPVGSVFRSQRFSVPVTPDTAELPTFELVPRVLLRGSIECTKADCSAQNAVFAAERLRTEDDDTDLPGPFYFEARADTLGNFMLPIDPGLYVVTAFPAIGQRGGPAPFAILDLREGSDLLTEIDGVLHATLDDPLALDNGVLVRVQLRDFPVSTTVFPLDLGSWTYQSDFPKEYDLNDPLTCISSSVRGCDIRRIRPTDAPISLQIAGSIQFTARRRGESSCPSNG